MIRPDKESNIRNVNFQEIAFWLHSINAMPVLAQSHLWHLDQPIEMSGGVSLLC